MSACVADILHPNLNRLSPPPSTHVRSPPPTFKVTVHEFSHTDERPFLCPYCPERYNASGSLRWHVRKHAEQLAADGGRVRYAYDV